MLTAKTLQLLADAAESHADDPREDTAEDRRRVQALRIAAADARQVADAGSGFGTPETLALAIVIDNDRAIAERRAALLAQAMDNAYSDVPEDADPETIARMVEEDDAARVSDLADALSELVEELAGFEGLVVTYPHDPGTEWTGDAGRTPHRQLAGTADADAAAWTLPDATHALARAAFRNVDWRGLAEHYITEHRLGEMADEVTR